MPPKIVSNTREFSVTQTELAEFSGRDARMIRKWEAANIIRKDEKGMYPVLASLRAMLDHACSAPQQKAATTAEKTAEQVRNLRLDAEAKERTRKQVEGEWIETRLWLDKIETHIGDLRQKLKNIFTLEQPVSLAGMTEIELREEGAKTYAKLCRWMQNAAGKLKPETNGKSHDSNFA